MGKRNEGYQDLLKREKSRRKGIVILLLILFILLGVLAVLGGILYMGDKGKEKKYFEYVEEANRYLSSEDYEGAELSYIKAIEVQPENPEAYMKLAAIYMADDRWEDTRKLLVRGIQETNSEVLFKTYERVLRELQGGAQIAETIADPADLSELSQNITVDSTIFDIAATYTYTDYVQHFGQPVLVTTNAKGGCDLCFDGYAGTLSFFNTEDNSYIYDSSTGRPYATRMANEVSFGSLTDVFGNYQGAVSLDKLKELFGEGVRVESDASGERHQVIISYHHCTFYMDCDENGNVLAEPTNRLVPAAVNPETKEEEGSRVSGYVINVMNGGGVNATLRFLKGGQFGTPEKEISAKFDGSFETQLPAGTYTVEIRAAGFITGYEEIEVYENQELTGLNFSLSPNLQNGEIRIVLTWGAQPYDLDSHLEGRSSSGNSIHISYMNMMVQDVAKLDLDDRVSYGPETTTIYDTAGSYTFSVYDFTNGRNSSSTALGVSGATVKVYLPGETQPVVYTVPAGAGTVWTVCRIENGQVTPVNSLR